MSNAQVSFASYVQCVEDQVNFLVAHTGAMQIMDTSHPDVRECYERNVSVDGCAASLVR